MKENSSVRGEIQNYTINGNSEEGTKTNTDYSDKNKNKQKL